MTLELPVIPKPGEVFLAVELTAGILLLNAEVC